MTEGAHGKRPVGSAKAVSHFGNGPAISSFNTIFGVESKILYNQYSQVIRKRPELPRPGAGVNAARRAIGAIMASTCRARPRLLRVLSIKG